MNIIVYMLLAGVFVAVLAKDVQVIEPDTSDIDRPCKFKDIKCIRRVITKKGWCTNRITKKGWCTNRITKKQPANKPFKIKKLCDPYSFSFLNVTNSQEDIEVTGLNKGKVVEFYFNEKTDHAVFSVTFTNIQINSTFVILYHRKAKEPIYIKIKVYEHYSSFTTTTILEGINKPNPTRSTTTYVKKLPKFSFSDGVEDIDNDDVEKLFAEIYAHTDVVVAELFVPRGAVFEDFFANNVICSPKTDGPIPCHNSST